MMLHSAHEPGCSSSEEISAGLGCIFNVQHKNRERCNGFLFSNKLPAVPPGSQGDVGGQKTRHWVIKTSGESQTALITQVSVLQGGASQGALQPMGMLRVYSSELLYLVSFLLLEWAQQIASW